LRNPPARSGAEGRLTVALSGGAAAVDSAPAGSLAAFGLAFAAVLDFAVVVFLAVVFFAVALDGFVAVLAVVVLADAARFGVLRDSAAVGSFMDDIVFAAVVSDFAAVTMALVAVFIAFRAVFIACAELVALLAAAVIFEAADETFVAADDTFVAAAAGVTELFLDVLADFFAVVLLVDDFLAAAAFVPPALVVRLELAVERRAVDRVVVFVGTDPSPRVDQVRRDAFHNWRRSTHRLDTRRPAFPEIWLSADAMVFQRLPSKCPALPAAMSPAPIPSSQAQTEQVLGITGLWVCSMGFGCST
jgi:hypothetical protein